MTNKINNYKLIFLINLKENILNINKNKIIKNYKNLIKNKKGKIKKTENLGEINLSYKIKKNYKAIYIIITFEFKKKLIKIIENKIKYDKNILRYLIIKKK